MPPPLALPLFRETVNGQRHYPRPLGGSQEPSQRAVRFRFFPFGCRAIGEGWEEGIRRCGRAAGRSLSSRTQWGDAHRSQAPAPGLRARTAAACILLQTGTFAEVLVMWLPSWLHRFAAGREHGWSKRLPPRPPRRRLARPLSVERLEERLAPAAGDLDLTFGTGGKVTTDFPTGTFDLGRALALRADGRIVMVGSTTSGGGSNNFG